MADSQEERALAELEENFQLFGRQGQRSSAHKLMKTQTEEWKKTDPEGFKKDMEEMCKAMFGDRWQVEYEAMLREEFPEEIS